MLIHIAACLSFTVSVQSIHTFTESQLQDFLHLRRLFLTRKALLAAEKDVVMSQLTDSNITSHSPHVDRLSSGLDLSKILKQYTLAEYRIFLQIAFVARRGVSVLCTVEPALKSCHSQAHLTLCMLPLGLGSR